MDRFAVKCAFLGLPFCFFLLPACSARNYEEIPLNSIYSTIEQEGLKGVAISDKFVQQAIVDSFIELGPRISNLFVVDGTISDAITQSLKMQGKARIYVRDKGEAKPLWLVVFFGYSSSSPRKWALNSVERGEGKIRVNYSLPRDTNQIRTANLVPRFLWVPLEHQKTGKYVLELVNASTDEVSLMRRVEIISKRD
jgi:hypothetical protein